MSKLTTVSHVICKKIMVKNYRLFIKLQDVTFLSCSKVYNILLSLWLRRKRTLTFQFIKVHCKNIPNFVFKDDLRKNTIFYVCLFDDVRSTLLRNGTTKIQFDQCFLLFDINSSAIYSPIRLTLSYTFKCFRLIFRHPINNHKTHFQFCFDLNCRTIVTFCISHCMRQNKVIKITEENRRTEISIL